MSFAYGIQAIHPSDAPHILGFATGRTGSSDLLLDVWNGSTLATRAFAVQKDGRVEMKDGTAGAPVLTFLGDLDSGLYRIGANNIGVSVGGSKVLDIGAATTAVTGAMTVSGALTIGGALAGVTSISASGNVTGTWNGTAISVAKGGTALTSYTGGDLLYATGSTTLAKLGIGTTGLLLVSNGSAPTWSSSASLTTLSVSTSLTVTGTTSLQAATGTTGTFSGAVRAAYDGTGTVASTADDFVVGRNSGSAHGMTILTSASQDARIQFVDAVVGTMEIRADRTNTALQFGVTGTDQMKFDGSKLYIRDSANADQTIGLTINQSTNSDEILALKSSSVAHAVTTYAESDTYASFRRLSGTPGLGGLEIRAMNAGGSTDTALRIQCLGNEGSGTKSVAARGFAEIICAQNDNAGAAGAVTANRNLLVVKNLTNARWLVDADGDMHFDGTSNPAAWDDHDDVGLLSTFRAASMGDGPKAQEWFGKWVGHAGNRRVLEESGVVSFNDDGHHFVSMKGLQALIIDAIRQTNQRWQEAVTELVAVNDLTPGPRVRALLEAR